MTSQTSTVRRSRRLQGIGIRRRQGAAVRRREALAGILFMLPVLVIFAAFKFLPIFGAAGMSTTKYRLNGDVEFVGADNYVRLFSDAGFWHSLQVTAVYVLIFVPLTIAISLGGAVLLNALAGGSGVFRALLFVPYLCSFVMAGIVWTWVFRSDGPVNSALHQVGAGPIPFLTGDQLLVLASLAVVSVWKGFGYSMLVFLSGLKAQPAEVHEAAMLDGASRTQIFLRIALPLLKPVLFFVLVMETIIGFQVFDTIYVMTGGGPARASHSLIYFLYDAGFKFLDFGYASAVGIVIFLIVLVLSIVQRRFFEERESA